MKRSQVFAGRLPSQQSYQTEFQKHISPTAESTAMLAALRAYRYKHSKKLRPTDENKLGL